jgi:hypothetical protein
VAQVKSRINIREIMDTKKIFIMNLSKGRIGEDNSRLLGGMLITKIQLSAMERVDIPEAERKDFFLYVDEFQNFATESFANILSEARKYRLDLIMAHQYMEQLDETVLAAVIGNVGTMVTFRVGSSDAEILAKEFIPTFVEEDLVNLPKYHVYLKLMIDGVASRPFSALTLPPIGSATGSREKVVRASRERYAVAREKIEGKIARWSGMEIEGVTDGEDDDEDYDLTGGSTQETLSASPDGPKPVVVEPVVKPVEKPSPPIGLQSVGGSGRANNNSSSYSPHVASKAPNPSYPRVGQSSQNSRPTQPTQVSSHGGSSSGSNNSSEGKKHGNKNKKRKPNNFNSMSGEKVFLVDPAQKGISLNQVLKMSPPQPRQNISNNRQNQSSFSHQPRESIHLSGPKNGLVKPEKHNQDSVKNNKQNVLPKEIQNSSTPVAHNTREVSLSQLKTSIGSSVSSHPQATANTTLVSSDVSVEENKNIISSSPKVLRPGEITKIDKTV